MLVAYALGKQNITDARRFFTRALTLSVSIGLLLTIVGGVLFPAETAQLLCSNEQILPLARDYMQVLLLGNPAFILMWGLSTMVGVDGQPKLVSVAVIIDNVVNLCELKFYSGEFSVDYNYEEKMRTRDRLVMEKISRKKVVRNTLVTTYGLKKNSYSGIFVNVITLDDLFA